MISECENPSQRFDVGWGFAWQTGERRFASAARGFRNSASTPASIAEICGSFAKVRGGKRLNWQKLNHNEVTPSSERMIDDA